MNCEKVEKHIIEWLKERIKQSSNKGFVVGISGGIDSAVVSTLCSRTGLPVIVINMPIHQVKSQIDRSNEHGKWLTEKFPDVSSYLVDLTEVFETFKMTVPAEAKGELALVNTRSRLRMITLYSFANTNRYLVCGTGNKIEDFGIGFFTKYGDGGVDISPIGDLVKSEVFELASYLNISKSILEAEPTDGLWEHDRTDEIQIGATYDELEWAMEFQSDHKILYPEDIKSFTDLTKRQIEILHIYLRRHFANKHKMDPPPVCILENVK